MNVKTVSTIFGTFYSFRKARGWKNPVTPTAMLLRLIEIVIRFDILRNRMESA